MAAQPRISCIVPVFNGERFLSETLKSIFRQSVRPDEVIVVDDGSTDRSPEIVAEFPHKVRYERKENGGPAAARNYGIQLATGDLISFLDHDDLWHPRKLELQLSRLNKEADLAFCRTLWRNFWVPEMHEEATRMQSSNLQEACPGPIQTMLIRRSVFGEIGMLDESKIHRDSAEFLARAQARRVRSEIVPEVLVFRRVHQANASRHRAGLDGDELLDIAIANLRRRRKASFSSLDRSS